MTAAVSPPLFDCCLKTSVQWPKNTQCRSHFLYCTAALAMSLFLNNAPATSCNDPNYAPLVRKRGWECGGEYLGFQNDAHRIRSKPLSYTLFLQLSFIIIFLFLSCNPLFGHFQKIVYWGEHSCHCCIDLVSQKIRGKHFDQKSSL